jgi:hypothetical protein
VTGDIAACRESPLCAHPTSTLASLDRLHPSEAWWRPQYPPKPSDRDA